jgi:hypothetical protein
MSHAVVSVDERALEVSYVDMRRLRKSHGMQSVDVWEVEVEGVRHLDKHCRHAVSSSRVEITVG